MAVTAHLRETKSSAGLLDCSELKGRRTRENLTDWLNDLSKFQVKEKIVCCLSMG